MKLIQNLKKLWTPISDVFVAESMGGQISKRSDNFLSEYKNIVYACINAIAEDVSLYTPIFTKGEKIIDHPFLTLLRYPDLENNIDQSNLLYATQAFIELTGEAFWYLPKGEFSQKPKMIKILRPDRMKVVMDKNTQGRIVVMGYVFVLSDGTEIPFTTDEILHFKTFNPLNPYRGLGVVEASMLYIDTEEAGATFQNKYLRNQATPSGVLSFKGNISREIFDKIKKKWKESYGGLENSGKTIFIRNSEIDFKKIGLSLSDINMEQLRKVTKEDVMQMFKVSEVILGKIDASGLGRAGAEVAEYVFAKRTIEPKLRRFDSLFELFIKKTYKEDIQVTHVSQVPKDKEILLKYSEASVNRWETINEVRAKYNLDKVDGGDRLYIGFSEVEIGKATGNKQFRGRIIEVSKKKINKKKEELKLFNALQKLEGAVTQKYTSQLEKFLKDQRKKVIKIVKESSTNKSIVETMDGIIFILSFEDREIEKLVLGLLAGYQESGELGLDLFGQPDEDFIISQAQREAIFDSTQRLLKSFNEETALKLQKQLVTGLSNNESVSELSKRVENIYQEAQGYRAVRIAQTESHQAINQGLASSYQMMGYQSMIWRNNPGACSYCQTMEGTVTRIGTPFIVQGQSLEDKDGNEYIADYQDVSYANLHPNCRCYLEPITE